MGITSDNTVLNHRNKLSADASLAHLTWIRRAKRTVCAPPSAMKFQTKWGERPLSSVLQSLQKQRGCKTQPITGRKLETRMVGYGKRTGTYFAFKGGVESGANTNHGKIIMTPLGVLWGLRTLQKMDFTKIRNNGINTPINQ